MSCVTLLNNKSYNDNNSNNSYGYNNNDGGGGGGVYDNHNQGLGRPCAMCIWHISYEMMHYESTIRIGPTMHPRH